jgi:hypothetical protein
MSTALSMYRGDTKVVQVTISNLTASGLTGYSYWFTAKNQYSDADLSAVIRKTGSQATPNDFTTVTLGDAVTSGVITCTINPADTNTLPDYDSQLEYDVQIEDASGHVTTVATGILTVKVDVTKTSI